MSTQSVAEQLAARIAALDAKALPPAVRVKCEDLLVDVAGLCVTARNEDYVKAALEGCDDDGPCTAIGHARTLSAAGAAFDNGGGSSDGGTSSASTAWAMLETPRQCRATGAFVADDPETRPSIR